MTEAPPAPWVPDFLSPKQQTLFNIGTQENAGTIHPNTPPSVLVCGPRYSSKSFGVDHRMIRHLWETPGARVAVISKTLRNATDSGTQQRLTEHTMPRWLDANIGLEYTTYDGDRNPGFKTDGRTRTPFFRITNMWGGESELRLLSVEHDIEIERKLKDSFWSMIRVVELANFMDPKLFTVSWEQLRMPHLKPWQHMWIADSNPAKEGPDSWIYKFWYKRDWGALGDGVSKTDTERKERVEKARKRFQESLCLLEVFLEDNPWLTPEQIEDRYAIHSIDIGEYERDVLGRWTKGSGGANRHFASHFSREIHVLEETETERIELSPTTTGLLSGWDLGSSVNHGVAFMEKRIINLDDHDWPVWVVLREIESIGARIKLSDIGVMAMDIIKELEDGYKRAFDWQHWSDDSAINVHRPTGEGFDYLEILAATDNKIQMQGVHKPSGSVETRIRLLIRLLKERRIYVSSKCPRIMEMLEMAARGTKLSEKILPPYKHIFDALTYPILAESADELTEIAFKPTTATGQFISKRL